MSWQESSPTSGLDARTALRAALSEVANRRRWLARPWEFAFDVIGPDALEDAAGRPVADFTPEQRGFLTDYCDRTKLRVILRTGRGGSKTFLQALGISCFAFCVPRFTGTILAGSLEQGRILYAYFERFVQSAKFAIALDSEPTKLITHIRGGGAVRVLTASEKQVKGPHPDLLDIDEACAADADILELAMGQRSGSRLGLLRVSSTPDKLFHPFRDWWNAGPEQGWAAHHWGLRRMNADGSWEPTLPWVGRELIDDLIATNPSNWVRIHIDGDFGSATGTVFSFEDIQLATIDDPLVRPIPEGLESKADPLFQEEAVTSVRIGVDWGFQNPTVLTVTKRLQVPNWKDLGLSGPDVYYVVHVEGWSQRSEDFLYQRIVDLLSNKLTSGDVYLDSSHIFQNETVRRLATSAHRTAHAIAFVKDKMEMVGRLNALLERRRIRIPKRFSETLEQLASYSWEEGKEKPMKVHDDYVDSLMLSVWGHQIGKAGPAPMVRGPLFPETGTKLLRRGGT